MNQEKAMKAYYLKTMEVTAASEKKTWEQRGA